MEGEEKIPKNKVRGEFWKNEAEDTTQQGVVGSNGRIRKRQGTPEIQKERSSLRNQRPQNRMPMTATPISWTAKKLKKRWREQLPTT